MIAGFGVERKSVPQRRSFGELVRGLSLTEASPISKLRAKGQRMLRDKLFSPEGYLYASDESGNFNHAFARDTMFVADDVWRTYPKESGQWQNTKRAVMWFWEWQKPDGFIPHEMRKVDPDKSNDPVFQAMMEHHFYEEVEKTVNGKKGTYAVNGDSIDATPLALMLTPHFVDQEQNRDEFL